MAKAMDPSICPYRISNQSPSQLGSPNIAEILRRVNCLHGGSNVLFPGYLSRRCANSLMWNKMLTSLILS